MPPRAGGRKSFPPPAKRAKKTDPVYLLNPRSSMRRLACTNSCSEMRPSPFVSTRWKFRSSAGKRRAAARLARRGLRAPALGAPLELRRHGRGRGAPLREHGRLPLRDALRALLLVERERPFDGAQKGLAVPAARGGYAGAERIAA